MVVPRALPLKNWERNRNMQPHVAKATVAKFNFKLHKDSVKLAKRSQKLLCFPDVALNPRPRPNHRCRLVATPIKRTAVLLTGERPSPPTERYLRGQVERAPQRAQVARAGSLIHANSSARWRA
jgi:hypothetical protein